MIRGRQHRFHLDVALLTVVLLTPVLRAQRADTGRGKFASATLPESNEALLLSSRVQGAIQAGDYRLAVELIDRLMDLPSGLVAAPASRTYYPAWRQALRLLAQLPEEGVVIYRQLHDAEVAARFAEAIAAADVKALRELFRSYRLSSAWPAIGVELTAHLLDRGAYGEAIEVLREMSSAGGGAGRYGATAGTEPGRYGRVVDTPEHRAQLAVALAGVGALQPAGRLLAELQADAELQVRPEWRDRLEQLSRWFASLRTERLASAGELARGGRVFTPRIETGPVWAQALLPEARVPLVDEGRDVVEAVEITGRLPLQQPVLAESADPGLLVRQHGKLWAIDAATLTLRWCGSERLSDAVAGVFSGTLPGRGAGGGAGRWPAAGDDHVRLSSDAQLLISNHLRHALSVGFGKVYTVEGLTLFDVDLGAFGQRPFTAARESVHRNELVARELDSGRLVWRTAAEPADPLFDVAFQNVPLVIGPSLVAPIVRGKELSLAVIGPADGRLIREVPLVGPPNRFPDEGGRCLMVSDETTLYVCTGNGVIAALACDDLSWKWATVYPSSLAEHLGQLWWQPQRKEEGGSVDPPVIADDLLVVAPVDSDPPAIFALDRFSGRQRWRTSRREYPFLIGVVRRGLVVAGHVVACFDLRDPTGRPPWWKSVPLRITGRAAIRGERVYVPTRDGIVVLDGQTGKVLADQIETGATNRAVPPAVPDRSANLLVGDDALFSVSPSRVVKYPDPCQSRAGWAAVPEGADAGDRIALVRAWLDALEGRYDDALTHLRGRVFDGPQLGPARDRLLKHVFLGLARDASAGDDRLEWLRRASALADSPQSAARLAVTIGQALEEAGRWSAALQHYGELLCRPDVCQVADPADADRRVAHWLHAAERIRAICGKAPAEAVAELLRQALDASERDEDRAVNLQRLRVALLDGPLRTQVDRLLSVQKLSPELKIRYLSRSDPASLPAGLRRRLHLERWDTHVSLGLLDQARQDRAVWQAQFADSQTPGGPAAPVWHGRPRPWAKTQPRAAVPPPGTAEGGCATALAGFEPLSPEEETERVAAIELASRKLAQAGGQPLTELHTVKGQPFTQHVARQWKIDRAELLLDSRRPLTVLGTSAAGIGGYILVADLGNRRIELINVYKHQHPRRQTEDRMIAGGFGPSGARPLHLGWHGRPRPWGKIQPRAAVPPAGQVQGRRFGLSEGRQNTWPAILYQQLAAVPVSGGLVCVGLGPERYAGRRQWQYAVPEWRAVPAGFPDRSVAGPQGVFFTPRRDRVALVGWFDGQLWWQRDLPGVTIERLHLVALSRPGQSPALDTAARAKLGGRHATEAGPRLPLSQGPAATSDNLPLTELHPALDRAAPCQGPVKGLLVIVADDQRVWVTDATLGRQLQRVPTGITTPRRIDVVGDTIVVWGPESVVGIASRTLRQLWARPCSPVADTVTVPQRPWIAYRARSEIEWHLLDVRGGEAVFDASLGAFGSISAIVADGDRLLVAGRVELAGEGEQAPEVRVVAIDAADGAWHWSREFATSVAVNATQLAAHPDYIPILLAPSVDQRGGSGDSPLPAIQLVNKRDGGASEPFTIRDDYRPAAEATCEMYMLATPTRMIVQAGGNLIAYGNSPLRSAP